MAHIPGLDAGSSVAEAAAIQRAIDAARRARETADGDDSVRTPATNRTAQAAWSEPVEAPSWMPRADVTAATVGQTNEQEAATTAEVEAAEERLLRLSRSDDPYAERTMEQIINPATGDAYTDAERNAAIRRAERREDRQVAEEVQVAEDRLLGLSRSDDPYAERTMEQIINPATGDAYTDAERAAAIDRATERAEQTIRDAEDRLLRLSRSDDPYAERTMEQIINPATGDAYTDAERAAAIDRATERADHEVHEAEDRLLRLSRSNDPYAERTMEQIINPATGDAYTDAERAAAIDRATERADHEVHEAEDRLLRLSRSDDPYAERTMEQIINPRTGVAYTDAERREALDNARVRDHERLNRVDGQALEHRFTGTNPEAAVLLAQRAYENHFLQGTDLDLGAVEAATNDFNGGSNHIVIQSIFDPVVSHKETTIDEYSVQVLLPEGMDPEEFLLAMAADMDGVLGGEFAELGDFKNQGETPHVGQVIDIDVEDGPQVPLVGWRFESPFNAPVVISTVESDRFTVQTIEYNRTEHLLHGTREWGFEEAADGSIRFYTRGVSVEDIQAAEGLPGLGGAKEGEFKFWNAWVDGVENFVTENGGTVVPGTRIVEQTNGPSGDAIWETLTPEQQEALRTSQIDGLERESARLEQEQRARLTEIAGIRDIDEIDGSEDLIRRIEAGDDTASILRELDDLIDANDGAEGVDQHIVDDMEDLYRDVRAQGGRIGELENEAAGWMTR